MTGVLPVNEPVVEEGSALSASSIELVIEGRPRDLGGGFVVRRLLPSPTRRLVGPFIFFDQMGPVSLAPGQGLDVRPHPHIALATVTYLFDGEIMHRDSLGSVQPIHPGDVNWMLAGRGIVHSERSSEQTRQSGQRLHGIQSWVALPTAAEESEPRFEHHPASHIPTSSRDGVRLDVVAGHAYGMRSPVGVLSETLYVHAQLDAGASLRVDDAHEERALYIVEGALELEQRTFGPGTMVVLKPGSEVSVRALAWTRAMLLGGEKLEGERHLFWNFVSSHSERLEQAKRDWAERRFPAVPGDDEEFIPLPS
ncbi:MAG: pirin [Myxococcaceae bacterium]|nr:pirin [Myxococcaceae bacterium]